MSDTPKSPLWKQLTGALAGAAVAFVLYEGYALTTSHLQAVVGNRGRVEVTGTLGFPAPGTVNGDSAVTAAQAVSASSVARVRRAHWYDSPASSSSVAVAQVALPASSASSASSAASPANYGRWTGPERTASFPTQQEKGLTQTPVPHIPQRISISGTLASSSSDAAWWVKALNDRPGAAVLAGTQAVQSSSSAASPVAQAVAAPAPDTVTSPVFSMHHSSVSVAPVPVAAPIVPSYVPAPIPVHVSQTAHPLAGSVTGRKARLPQSGFGLDILAVTALGAVIGRKRAMKK